MRIAEGGVVADGTPIVGVGVLVLRSDGAILLGHRIKKGETPSWCLPGGRVEPGETFEVAAAREVAEETGIGALADPEVFTIVVDTGAPGVLVTAGVWARLSSACAEPVVAEPDNFDRWIWVSPNSLPTPLFPASAALFAAWCGRRQPDGWTAYPTAVPNSVPR
ncbi:nucleotide triphosphate diphosphatase NUDT15 [Nocardia arthritidis]|uniref:NUDIX domain-containing protein n=1 Tax=Nocardia arthritidis TaxID=228602 RepID=A0A6G9Y6M1_9NOCA|nr:NUDIX domain-containing protein [Nocardia arthritidis]QIS08727.1 NUDIX domain-containing protein [Nocardia arthritidis]